MTTRVVMAMKRANFWIGVLNVPCVVVQAVVLHSIVGAVYCAFACAMCLLTCTPPWVRK